MKKLILKLFFIGSIILFISYNLQAQVYEWALKMGGTDYQEGRVIIRDASGNIYTMGVLFETADFDPGPGTANLTSAGAADIYLAKYDSNGNYIWAFKIGGTDSDQGSAIAIDAMGNVYVYGSFRNTADFDPGTGTINLTSAGNYDIFIAKYSSSGSYINVTQLGASGSDGSGALLINTAQEVIITGAFSSTIDFNPDTTVNNLSSAGNQDLFIAKYDTGGNYIWAIKAGGTGMDGVRSIAEDSSGNIYATGSYSNTVDFDPSPTDTANIISAGVQDAFLAKYDASGNYLFAYGLGGLSVQYGMKVCLDPSGNVYLTGNFEGTMDIDPDTGSVSLTSSGVGDIFVAKYNPNGNFILGFKIGGTGDDVSFSIVTDNLGSFYVCGYFGGTIDFDPGPGTANYIGTAYDGFIAKYDINGSYRWVIPMVGPGYGGCFSMVFDSSQNIYATGSFGGTTDFNPGTGINNLVGSAAEDAFIAKYSPCKDPLVVAPTINPVSCADDTTLLILNVSGTELSYQWEVNEGTGFSTISNTFPYLGVTNDTLIITPYAGMNAYLYRCVITGSCNPVSTIFSDTAFLNVNPSYLFSNNLSICSGDSALIFGIFRSAPGSYYDSLQTFLGCDSVYEFVLSLDPTYTFNDTVSICDGDSIFVGGAFQFAGGTYYDNYATSKGCDSTYITELILKPLPDANIGPDTLWACNGQLLSFGIDTSNNDVSSYSLGNSFNLVFDDSLTFSYDAGNPAPYVMAEVEGINGCFSTDSVTLMNNMIGNIQQGPIIVNEQFITFIATIPAVVDSFFWNFGDGNTLTGDANPTHEYTTNGVYLVCLTTTNECETDSDCIAVNVNVGMEEEVLQNIIIAPNPVKNVLSISNLQNETDIAIYNALGEVIFKKNCNEDLSIDLSAYKNGLYFIELKNKNAFSRRIKIVKTN